MRFIALMLATLALGGCEMLNDAARPQVDSEALQPISGRERALIIAAGGAMQQGNLNEAERDYLSAMALSQGHVDAHLGLAQLYAKQGAVTKAQSVLESALDIQPGHPGANYQLGKLYLGDGHYEKAREAFRRGLRQRPADADLAMGEAVANDMLGEHAAAQAIYTRLMRSASAADSIDLSTNLAMSYLFSNQPQKAVALLKPLMAKPSVPSVARHDLALAYGLLGQHAQAKAVLHGDIDEESRTLSLARLKEYLRERQLNHPATPPLPPEAATRAAPATASKKPAAAKK